MASYISPGPRISFIPIASPKLRSAPPTGPDWLHEVKFDGYRIQAQVSEGEVKVLTRAGLDWTGKFGTAIPGALSETGCQERPPSVVR